MKRSKKGWKMKLSRTAIQVFAIIAFLAIFCQAGFASDIYISQAGGSTQNGSSCADAYPVTWFNSTSPVNISGGNNYHMCGTFTGTSGSSMLTVPASGSSGSPISILFESGAKFTAPYFSSNGAINLNGKSYVTINGQSQGIIENSANGTSLANHQGSSGIQCAGGCTNITIQNLTIQKIYANGGSSSSANDSNGQNTWNISFTGTNNHITIDHNTLSNARSGVNFSFDSSKIGNIVVSNNTIFDHAWQIGFRAGNGGSGEGMSGPISVYGNEIYNYTNWQYPVNTYHTDGIIMYEYYNDTSALVVSIYNNYFHGSLGSGSPTAYIFVSNAGDTSMAGGGSNTGIIYNNLFSVDESPNTVSIWLGSGSSNNRIYNNTFIGNSSSASQAINGAGNTTIIENNIFESYGRAIYTYDSSLAQNYTTVDYNDYYNVGSSPICWNDGASCVSLASFQSSGYESHGQSASPNLNSTYKISSASGGAYHNGANLTGAGITALNSDKAGTARPSSGAWDVGAYQYFTGTASIPSPTSLHQVLP